MQPTGSRAHGGCIFPFNPAIDPQIAPAFWRAEHCPLVISLSSSQDLPKREDHIRVFQAGSEGTDLFVIRGRHVTHRLTRAAATGDGVSNFSVRADAHLRNRLACIDAFATGTSIASRRVPRPTPYQIARLALFLSILDRLNDGSNGPAANIRSLASDLVFPGAPLPARAIEWKTSSYRRHTQRLVAAARVMCRSGYLHLLVGRLGA